MKQLISAILVFISLSAQAADIDCASVLLRSVDKITGRTNTMEVKIGESINMGNLKVTAERCLKKPPEETPENAAFLMVEENTKEDAFNTVFNGWMFSSNPAISAMEHPIWDIWVLECVSDEPAPTASSEKIQPPALAVKPVDVEDLDEI